MSKGNEFVTVRKPCQVATGNGQRGQGYHGHGHNRAPQRRSEALRGGCNLTPSQRAGLQGI